MKTPSRTWRLAAYLLLVVNILLAAGSLFLVFAIFAWGRPGSVGAAVTFMLVLPLIAYLPISMYAIWPMVMGSYREPVSAGRAVISWFFVLLNLALLGFFGLRTIVAPPELARVEPMLVVVLSYLVLSTVLVLRVLIRPKRVPESAEAIGG